MRTGRPQKPLSYLQTGMKRCRRCKRELPLDRFHTSRSAKNGRKYPYSYCKECHRKNTREFLQTPRGKEVIRIRNLQREFRMSVAEYDAMLARQNGVCAICAKPETQAIRGKVRWLCVDHDHKTGLPRGLLCAACNKGIGYFGDDLGLLHAAIKYLQKHSANQEG